jgi:hypothetical protein
MHVMCGLERFHPAGSWNGWMMTSDCIMDRPPMRFIVPLVIFHRFNKLEEGMRDFYPHSGFVWQTRCRIHVGHIPLVGWVKPCLSPNPPSIIITWVGPPFANLRHLDRRVFQFLSVLLVPRHVKEKTCAGSVYYSLWGQQSTWCSLADIKNSHLQASDLFFWSSFFLDLDVKLSH